MAEGHLPARQEACGSAIMDGKPHRTPRLAPLALLLAATACAAPAAPAAPASAAPLQSAAGASSALAPQRWAPVRAYIRATWASLTRGDRDLARAAIDLKAAHAPGAPWPVYIAASEDRARIAQRIASVLPPESLSSIDLRVLPADPHDVAKPGLLYLPRPYVVPGGRFNEMYGWDSYFILLGLLREGETARARDLVDDFLYEVVHYGGVLNANRTYYLTRSQPPLLGAMVWAVFSVTHDRAWLASALPALEATYRHWTTPPHLIEAIDLSRYYDHGEGPAPEVVSGERDAGGRSHYDRVKDYYRRAAAREPVETYYRAATDELTPRFFKGDRSMRESGFDPSDRFGRFGADVIRYAPVCLNTLLFQLEQQMARIAATLGGDADAVPWRSRADARQAAIDRFLWDQPAGLYFDYDFEAGRRRVYPFATTFWPLAAGLASPSQALRVRDNLRLFERPGGVLTSVNVSGSQWDAPFGWAPLQLFAVEGLRRYGFAADAARVTRAFLSMLVEDFERRGTLVEKYDVERRTSDSAGALRFGYTSNEVGFGWTNGVALELAASLR
ncbi:MAG TPA: trehalase family glycosidase [Polyangia bacterium]|nr:trehalase family glycosidase [Polyangia bacterium]